MQALFTQLEGAVQAAVALEEGTGPNLSGLSQEAFEDVRRSYGLQ